jgi:hypothetical protein
MKRLRIVIFTMVCLSPALLGGVARADSTVTVGFDNLANGTTVTNQYQTADGLYFQGSATGGGQDGVTPTVVTNSHAPSQPNAALINCIGCGELAGPAHARGFFDIYATGVSVYVGELNNAPDWEPPAGDTAKVELQAFGAGGNQIGSTATTTVTVGESFVQLRVSDPSDQPEIAYFDVTQVYANPEEPTPKPVGIDSIGITRSSTPPPPSFSLDADGNGADVTDGLGASNVALTVHRANGSNGSIGLSVSGLPAGVTSSFSQNPVTGTDSSSTLMLTAGGTAPAGYYNLVVTATPQASGAGSVARSVTIPVEVIANCTKFLFTSYIAAQSGSCFTELPNGTYEAYNIPVELNGLELEPETTTGAGSNLNIDLTDRKITGVGEWKATIAGAPGDTQDVGVWEGTPNWSVQPPSHTSSPTWQSGDPITVVDADNSASDLLVEGLPIGHTKIAFTAAGGASVTPTLTLSFWPFSYLGGLTAAPTIATSNSGGPQWSAVELKIGNVQAFGFGLKDVDLKIVSANTWQGTATLVLPTPNNFGFTIGIGLKNGNLNYLKGGVTGLNVALVDGIFLQSIALSGGGSGVPWDGTIGLTAGPQVAGKSAVTITGNVIYTPGNMWTLEVTGNAKLGGTFKAANADVKYISDGTLELKAGVSMNAVIATLSGSINGWIQGTSAFDFEGSLQACVDVWVGSLCAGANALVSNIGIAACINLDVVSGGVGYYWGGSFDAFSGCDLSPWRPTMSAVSALAPGRSRTVTLPAGLPSVVFRLTSPLGASGVSVRGPGGVSITGTRMHPDVRHGNALALVTKTDATYVIVKDPAAGSWKLTNRGPTPVTQLNEADGLPQPSVKARVSGSGATRTLTWKIRKIADQKVQFAEYGNDVRHLLMTTTKATGKIRFTPQAGPAGRRTIVAIVEQYGLPRKTITVASFRSLGPPKPGKVTKLKLTRKGTSVVVGWKAPKSAYRHAVYADLTDGRRLLLIVAARATSATFTGIAETIGATVRVTGLTATGGKGPTVTAKLG